LTTNVNKFVKKPEILSHPNIPKPLHGIAPRTIKGTAWWNETRQKAYEKYDYHCIACGVHKSKAKWKQWLEAHEYWKIDYNTGICEIQSIEPLCHYCHNFIHSGRLKSLVDSNKMLMTSAQSVLEHGFKILAENNLKAFPGTISFAKEIGADTYGVKPYDLIINESVKWKDYVLVFEGKEYHSKFTSEKAWKKHYNSI
jgi:hypothetical protein